MTATTDLHTEALVAAATRIADRITDAGQDDTATGNFARLYATTSLRAEFGADADVDTARLAALNDAIVTGAVDPEAATFARNVATAGLRAYRRAADPAAARRADVDAREACVRCGGSGQYAQYGDCYRCGGSGRDPRHA